jgi:hypothetical protein
MEPLELPQSAAVVFAEALRAVGDVMVTEADPIHPTSSVTATVYVPAISPVALAAVPPEGDQAY